MAFMDDVQFIISQIRHSCVTSDDTGMSEIVIVNEETENENLLRKRKFGNWDNENGFDYPNSFDIEVSPMQGGIGNSVDPRKPENHRKDSKNSETKCKTISWKDQDGAVSDSELSQVFAKKDIVHHDKKDGKKVSKLSEQIKASINQPKNPFAYYGKFNGEGYERTNKVRGFKIFFPLSVTKGKQHASMDVCLIVDNAHVQDLIGLIMFKYTQQGINPELKGDVKSYCLLIADELDGEVDFDLPALDNKEMISKFDFKALALSYIKKEEEAKEIKPSTSNSTDIIVEVCEEKRGSSKFAVNKWDLDMRVVMEKMLKKRGLKRTGHEYVLVKKSDPGTAISLDDTLDTMQTLQFQLVKHSSIPNKKDADKDKNEKEIQDQEFFTNCAQYKSFKVTMLHRFRSTSDVQLGIDSRNIEIHHATQPNQRTSFLNRFPKAVTIEMDDVVDSEIIKSGNRSTFRINYCAASNHDFKNYDFECSNVIAGEIVRKIELILNASPKSTSQIEYQKFKDKRSKKS